MWPHRAQHELVGKVAGTKLQYLKHWVFWLHMLWWVHLKLLLHLTVWQALHTEASGHSKHSDVQWRNSDRSVLLKKQTLPDSVGDCHPGQSSGMHWTAWTIEPQSPKNSCTEG